ncbi:hypothetical protein ACOME3_005238 [Neoechinorhynchus agilis]
MNTKLLTIGHQLIIQTTTQSTGRKIKLLELENKQLKKQISKPIDFHNEEVKFLRTALAYRDSEILALRKDIQNVKFDLVRALNQIDIPGFVRPKWRDEGLIIPSVDLCGITGTFNFSGGLYCDTSDDWTEETIAGTCSARSVHTLIDEILSF